MVQATANHAEHRYECPNLGCMARGKEIRHGMDPYEARDLPVQAIRCIMCKCPMIYLGKLGEDAP